MLTSVPSNRFLWFVSPPYVTVKSHLLIDCQTAFHPIYFMIVSVYVFGKGLINKHEILRSFSCQWGQLMSEIEIEPKHSRFYCSKCIYYAQPIERKSESSPRRWVCLLSGPARLLIYVSPVDSTDRALPAIAFIPSLVGWKRPMKKSVPPLLPFGKP